MNDATKRYLTWEEFLKTVAYSFNKCAGGCDCRVGTYDAYFNGCSCDGPCQFGREQGERFAIRYDEQYASLTRHGTEENEMGHTLHTIDGLASAKEYVATWSCEESVYLIIANMLATDDASPRTARMALAIFATMDDEVIAAYADLIKIAEDTVQERSFYGED